MHLFFSALEQSYYSFDCVCVCVLCLLNYSLECSRRFIFHICVLDLVEKIEGV